MEFLTLITDGPVLLGIFTLMLFASNNRVVNFSHQVMKLTSTGTEMFISKFTIFADFLPDHFLDIFHVPELSITGKLISESVPIKEIGDKLQSSSEIFIEDFVSEMLQIFSGTWTFLNSFIQNADSVSKLFIFLLKIQDLFVERNITHY